MNFILRTITEGNVCNQIIGTHYSRILRSLTDEKSFNSEVLKFYPEYRSNYINDVVAIVLTDKAHLITKNQDAYIMTESGKTFEKI